MFVGNDFVDETLLDIVWKDQVQWRNIMYVIFLMDHVFKRHPCNEIVVRQILYSLSSTMMNCYSMIFTLAVSQNSSYHDLLRSSNASLEN